MKLLRDYFNIDRKQERGLLVLSLLMVLAIIFNYAAPRLFSPSQKSLVGSKVFTEKLKKQQKHHKELVLSKKREIKNNHPLSIDRRFDPNSVSKDELIAFKIPGFVAANWEKYINSGGVFKKESDIKKIYGINQELYDQIAPWILIESTKELVENNSNSFKTIYSKSGIIEKKIRLGINTADSIALLEVNGIGPFYAGEIVKYRKKLGGYVNINQLTEIYKIDTLKLNKLKKQLYLDTIEVRKISINTVGFKNLLSHPYSDFETTKYILNKRNKLGKYAALYQIRDNEHITDSLFFKILPYLSLDE
jgi:competence protein ComEA